MRSVKFAVIAGTLALVGSAIHAGDQQAGPQKPATTSTAKPACSPVSCVEFSQAIDAWRLACLAGEDKLATEGEQKLMNLIDRDLERCASELSQFHDADNSTSPDKSTASSKNSNNEELKGTEDTFAWEMFGAKKQIARNIRHTDAFSNKYRLLGDYEDLIKREKSADRAGVPLDMQEKGEHTLREAGK